jgi:hypothetical protein
MHLPLLIAMVLPVTDSVVFGYIFKTLVGFCGGQSPLTDGIRLDTFAVSVLVLLCSAGQEIL